MLSYAETEGGAQRGWCVAEHMWMATDSVALATSIINFNYCHVLFANVLLRRGVLR